MSAATVQAITSGMRPLVDLSANENPLGPSPRVATAIQQAVGSLHRYPSRDGVELRESLAKHLGVNHQQLILGNGACELLEFAARATLQPGHNAVVSWPAFLPYRKVVERCHAEVLSVPLLEGRNNLAAMQAAISANTRLLILGNPNNPTGAANSTSELEALLKALPRRVLVVLDEAYIEYAEPNKVADSLSLLSVHSNLLILRSLSKAYGLAGLRMGYGIGAPDLVVQLNHQRQHFNTNALAQAAALAALQDDAHLRATLACNRAGKQQLYRELARLQVRFHPTQANFILLELPEAQDVVDQLARRGVLAKSLTPFGLRHCLRVSIGLADQNQCFIDALTDILASRAAAAGPSLSRAVRPRNS